ncbi:hypothetical protein ACP275_02G131400 [Erythranthe tilingii]
MNLAYQHRPSSPLLSQLNPYKIPRINHRTPKKLQILCAQKRCLRCNTLYENAHNSPTACSFHAHTTGMNYIIYDES